MTYNVYECDLIGYLQPPQNEKPIRMFLSFGEASEYANQSKRQNPQNSYTVGMDQ